MIESVDTETLLGEAPPLKRIGSLQAIFVICLFGWLAFALVHFFKGYSRATIIDLSAAIPTALLLIAYRVRPQYGYAFSMSNLVVASIALTAASLNMGSGATAVWFLVTCPLVASYHHGLRETVAWTAFAGFLVAVFHLTPRFFTIIPEYIPGRAEFGFAQTMFLGLIAAFALASNRANRMYVRQLQERETQVRDKAKQVREHAGQLKVARDQALEALRVRSEFVANVSHEIRTPLNGVLGMTRVLLESGLSTEQELMVRTIDKSGTSLLGVINEILDFSKLESGEVEVEQIPFDLRECIEDVLDLYSGPAHEKGLDVAYVMDPTTPRRVLGDVTRLRQILLNLVSNAVKFTQSGEVFVHVWCETDEQVHFEVRDTGLGISASDQERLFQSFVQADPSTTRRFGGTGLGLSISQRLAETLGGTMWVESEIGVGSSFHFTVNLEQTDGPFRTGELSDPMSLFGRRMLVVSPNSASRDALFHMTDHWGMSFAPADTPADVGAAIESLGTPHVVIVFRSEDLAEVRAALEVARPAELPPIVMVASLADPVSSQRNQKTDALLLRPIRYRQLRGILDGCVGGHAVHSPRSLSPFDPTLGILVPLNIVVAEDNVINQQVIEAMLVRLGYKPKIVSTGIAAVEAVSSGSHVDLVFMDMHMPEMDGLEATRTIRAMSLAAQPAIVAITADVSEAHRKKSRESGMDEFLGKPIEVEALVHCIEQIGKGRGLLESADTHEAMRNAGKFDAARLEDLRVLFPPRSGEFARLIEKHVQTTDELIAKIQKAVHEKDFGALKMSSHSLKSTSAMFGSKKLSVLSGKIETLAEEHLVGSASGLLPDLNDAWAYAKVQLRIEASKDS